MFKKIKSYLPIDKIYTFLEKPSAVIVVLLIATLLAGIDRNIGYFFALGIVILILRKNKYNWNNFGFGKQLSKTTIIKAFLWASLSVVIVDFLAGPWVIHVFGETDISSLEGMRGDFANYAITMVMMWLFAAFGEELVFRGYYMKGIAELFGNSNKAWLFAVILIGIYFGVSHAYQGPAGMILVSIAGIIYGMAFYTNRDNLAIGFLAHGFYNTFWITLLYLDREKELMYWIDSLFGLA